MSVEDVFDATLTYLRANTPMTWFEWFVPDDDAVHTDGVAYGVASVLGPFETFRDWNICDVADQPYGGTILVGVTAPTAEAVKEQAKAVSDLLRGWSPGSGTSAFTSTPARGYEPVDSKFEPTLVTRQMLFRFTTNL